MKSDGSGDKTLKLYEGGFHDLLNDVDKRVVVQDIQDWIGEVPSSNLGAPTRISSIVSEAYLNVLSLPPRRWETSSQEC
jgi:hypothetical protein